MGNRTVNATQLAVLRWIHEGNVGAIATNAQRLSARALASRRLVSVKGHGSSWSATLTDAGRHYLKHGDYPEGHFPVLEATSTRTGAPTASVSARQAAPQREAPPTIEDREVEQLWRRVVEQSDSPVMLPESMDRMHVDALITASFHSPLRPRGKRLAAHGRGVWARGPFEVRLEPYFEEEVALVEVAVPEKVSRYHPIVKAFARDHEWSYVSREAQPRAARVLQAIVDAAVRRGYTTELPTVSSRQGARSRARRDRFVIGTPDGSFIVQICEIPKTGGAKLPYRSWGQRKTRPEWVEQRGYEFIPTGRLEVTVGGSGGYGGAKYRDAKTHKIEDRIGALFKDLEVARLYRAHAARERERAEEVRKTAWAQAMDAARQAYRRDARLKHVRDLADAAEAARERRGFAAKAAAAVDQLTGEDRTEALAAVRALGEWVDEQDPLIHPELFAARVPDPKPDDLKPYLGSWSPHGPDGSRW